MAYTAFSDNNIFADPQLNTLCNSMVNYVVGTMGLTFQDLVISGTVAAQLQDKGSGAVPVISFVTDSLLVFNTMAVQMSSVYIDVQVLRFRNCTRFKMGTLPV